ncbi:MAG: DNA gyrase subunit A [Alphaproteobacteria bacterium]|nr:DNA gyrase subunit A [Alphaproteobacteria bacterium]
MSIDPTAGGPAGPSAPGPHDISHVTIEEEMRRSYLDYAMSVIVSRALPDARDGLKPVHRRILYAMKEAGYDHNRPYRKAARIVGDVMGKYHPHGDTAIYDAMVRMAQDFSMRLPLIDGQGNFGSMDGDPPAAMRYTEARLALAAESLLDDIDKDTVEFQNNYDDSASEPVVLPARFPNLLVNGAGGIAVGMATNIPTHNLGEVIDACCAYLDNPGVTIDELMEHIPGPDFPTGGSILGQAGIRAAFHTGRGSIVMRGKTEIQEIRKDREAIIITEIPYQVNKARMIERIAELAQDKTIEGISDLRDESDRDGVRVVVELKRDAQGDVVLNQLYRYSPLQTSFGVNMLALNERKPEQMNLKQLIAAFIRFREEVITRRTEFELGKARERAHVLAGLLVAISNIDPVIELIRRAKDPAEAREQLMAVAWDAGDVADFIRLIDDPGHTVDENGRYRLSETQARAILDLRLQRLTGLERDKLVGETTELSERIEEYLIILRSSERLRAVLRDELLEMRDKFATPRRTMLEESELDQDVEDLIAREDMVVTVTHGGYIKRVPLATYRAQRRGGKGRSGMATREEDFVSSVFVANTHTPLLLFSSSGMVYKMKVYRLPIGTPQARGKALVNLLPLDKDETISTVMPLPEDEDTWAELFVMFSTRSGNVRRNALSDFVQVKANGKIAMKLGDDDRLVGVEVCDENSDILLATAQGKCIRFSATDVRVFAGRSSVGVRGIDLAAGDRVISMAVLRHFEATREEREAFLKGIAGEENGEVEAEDIGTFVLSDERRAEMAADEQLILSISEDGYGKRSSAFDYRTTNRGGKGIDNMVLARSGGAPESQVAAAFPVAEGDEIMLVTDGGQIIRCPVDDISKNRRKTRGVVVFRVAEDEHVVSVTWLREEDETEEDEENGEAAGSADISDA